MNGSASPEKQSDDHLSGKESEISLSSRSNKFTSSDASSSTHGDHANQDATTRKRKPFLLEPKINTPFGMDVGVGQLLHLVGVIDPSVLKETLPELVHDTIMKVGSSIVVAATQASASYDHAKHVREETIRREQGALAGSDE